MRIFENDHGVLAVRARCEIDYGLRTSEDKQLKDINTN